MNAEPLRRVIFFQSSFRQGTFCHHPMKCRIRSLKYMRSFGVSQRSPDLWESLWKGFPSDMNLFCICSPVSLSKPRGKCHCFSFMPRRCLVLPRVYLITSPPTLNLLYNYIRNHGSSQLCSPAGSPLLILPPTLLCAASANRFLPWRSFHSKWTCK